MRKILLCLLSALLLSACQSVPRLHPQVIMFDKDGVYVYDVLTHTRKPWLNKFH